MKCNDVANISWDESGLHGAFTVKVEGMQPDEFFSFVARLRGCISKALDKPVVKPRKLDKVRAAAAENWKCPRWNQVEIDVIKHCDSEESAWAAYDNAFPNHHRSKSGVFQKWHKLHVKVTAITVKPAAEIPVQDPVPEPAPKTTQFKVGDRVKQIAGAFMTNETGTIVTVRADKAHVNFKGVPHWLLFTEMKKVTDDANV